MKKALYFILLVLIFHSCGEKNSAEDVNTNKSIENKTNNNSIDEEKDHQKPKSMDLSNIKDTILIHIFKTGDNLWNMIFMTKIFVALFQNKPNKMH